MNHNTTKLILMILTTSFFIAGFVLNITSDQALYNQDLNIVPIWQANSVLGSSGFLDFMNIVSIVFDPPICAGYLALFWLLSSRRLQIMVFLVWFTFMCWILAILKSAIQQPRPFWIPGSQVQDNSWTCYTDFGCPSGHSWLGLVIMEWIVRFFARGYKLINKFIAVFYILIIILQLLVMFSRVILGMHTFNEVLMGAMIGIFSLTLYYSFTESLIVKIFATILNTKEAHPFIIDQTSKHKKTKIYLVLILTIIILIAVDMVVYFIPTYQNQQYWIVIKNTNGCGNVNLYKSFQYRSLQDSSILMVGTGIIFSLFIIKDPSILVRPLAYSRLSFKFIGRLIIFIILAAIPLAAFINPGWTMINVETEVLALILWGCQSVGFFLALVMLVVVAPYVCNWFKLQQYGENEYIVIQEQGKRTSQYELGTTIKNG